MFVKIKIIISYLSSTEVVNRTCRGQSAEYFNLRLSQPFSFIAPVDLLRILSPVTTQEQPNDITDPHRPYDPYQIILCDTHWNNFHSVTAGNT